MVYFLDIVSGMCNLFCAVFRCYPRFDFGLALLASLEVQRMCAELDQRFDTRNTELAKADSLKEQAVEELNVRDK